MAKPKRKGNNIFKDKLVVALIIAAVAIIAGGGVLVMGDSIKGGLPEVSAATCDVSPITGQAYDTELPARPLIVSIDNVGDAIPQSWISKADIVYEFPVEGRQTRLQAVYYGEFPEEFGPIRSTRPYFVDLTREYKGIFLAHGWSPQAQEYLMTGVVPYINAMNSSLNFYRVDDKEAPHNSYIKWDTVKGEIDAQGWWAEDQKIKPFSFLAGAQVNEGASAKKIEFVYTSSECEFTYNAETGKYTRTIGGSKYVDHETGKSVTVDNILMQKVTSSELDNKGRLKIDMCAGGDAILFTNGVAVKGTWSREDLDSRTIFVDENGNEFKLTPGQTWVEIADQNCSISYK
ncbi:MAG: DUF3048 domain-containing protein [Bacillota bacterium]|nr:DUF3048 domain-containing protein [Bacillota bacterium]